MCESCDGGIDRRSFLASGGALGGVTPVERPARPSDGRVVFRPRETARQGRGRVPVPAGGRRLCGQERGRLEQAQLVHLAGQPVSAGAAAGEVHRRRSTRSPDDWGWRLIVHPQGIYQDAKIKEFIAATQAARLRCGPGREFLEYVRRAVPTKSRRRPRRPRSSTSRSGRITSCRPKSLRNAEGLFYIHSIENWDEIERGLRAVRTAKMMAQSRLLRISGRVQEDEPRPMNRDLGTHVVSVPAEEYNALFDSIKPDAEITALAEADQGRGEPGHGRDGQLLRRRDPRTSHGRRNDASDTAPMRSRSSACS